MPSLEFHRSRRSAFLDSIDGPVLLFAGGFLPRNYPANVHPFRADSTFLYFFDRPEPDAAAWFDPADRSVTLFLHERTASDALWHGVTPPFEEELVHHGVDSILAVETLEENVRKLARGRAVRTLAVSDPRTTALANRLTGESRSFDSVGGLTDPKLADVLFALRSRKQPEEIEEMRHAAAVTREAHVQAMAITRPGGTEAALTAVVEGSFVHHGCTWAYPTILSVRGEVLHNNHHGNDLRSGDLVLLDAGAEAPSGYCADVTRTWPANGRFDSLQSEIYDIVLSAELAAIAKVKPGARYRDLHMESARVIADGLVQMGFLRGSTDSLVESGAHAMFFPHGVGHQIGLDVHDMEAFGDRVHYQSGRSRSDQFGTCYLRMDRDLVDGMVFTIEPGIYFVPAILTDRELVERFGGQVDFARALEIARKHGGRGFGGVRIEDDVLCTATGPTVLTDSIPKERAAIESLVGSSRG